VYKVSKIRDNLGIYTIATTQYANQGTLSILTEIFNEGKEERLVPISVYVDDLFFGTKEMMVSASSSSKIFFDGLPITTKVIKAEIAVEDHLMADNRAYTVVGKSIKKRFF